MQSRNRTLKIIQTLFRLDGRAAEIQPTTLVKSRLEMLVEIQSIEKLFFLIFSIFIKADI